MKHSLLLAIPVSHQLLAAGQKIRTDIDQRGIRVNWFKPEHLHLQLNYLGRIPDQAQGQIHEHIFQIVHATAVFSINFVYFQVQYVRHGRTKVQLIPAPNSDLAILQKSLRSRLQTINIPQPSRFFPELVLGEFERADPTTIKRQIARLSDYELAKPLPLLVEKVILLEALFDRRSVHYRRVAAFATGQSPGGSHPSVPAEPATPDILGGG